MLKSLYRSTVMTLGLLLILCVLYPAVVTGIGQAFFKDTANGGLIYRDGRPVGAHLIGQAFTSIRYFHPRPSAAGESGYDAAASSGSNLGPTNSKLFARVTADVAKIREENPAMGSTPVPVDLVTTSASGLDPHISPAGARYQIARIAEARGLPIAAVAKLIDDHTEGPQLGFLGASVVNVLELNLALDAAQAQLSPAR